VRRARDHERGHPVEAAAHPAVLERLQAGELAVQDGADRELGEGGVDAREALVVAAAVAGEQPRAVVGDVRDCADAVPLGLEHPTLAGGQLAVRRAEHRCDRAVEQRKRTVRQAERLRGGCRFPTVATRRIHWASLVRPEEAGGCLRRDPPASEFVAAAR
jgi:hypothetical protein